MIWLLLASVGFSTGIWLLASALWPAPTPLSAALERLHTPRPPRSLTSVTTAGDRSAAARMGRWMLRQMNPNWPSRSSITRDLEITGRSLELHVGVTVFAVIAGLGAGPLLWATAATAGDVTLPFLVSVWFGLVGGAVGGLLPWLTVRAEGARARRDFQHALGAYLDLLVLLLAANEGPEGAMATAARRGQGHAFAELRRAINEARLSGDPVWRSLDELGQRIGVDELREIAAAGSLAGERGAAVRQSLVAKARSLRASSLSAAEANARKRSQAMFGPILLMGIGFIVFLIYPLVSNINFGA